MIDPLERWRELGLPDKPDYAGPAHLRGAAVHAGSRRARRRRRRDRRRPDRRPRLGSARNALRPPRDPRRGLPARAAPRGRHRRGRGAADGRLRRRAGRAGRSRRAAMRRSSALVGQVVAAGRDPGRPRRRPLDRRARHPRRRRRARPGRRSSTSTRTRTRARRSSASRSRTGRRCTGSSATATSTRRATCRSACAATGRARRSSPGRRERGITSFFMHDVRDLGIRAVVEQAVGERRRRAGFLSVDVDVLDPAFAPGTGTPEPGGMTSADLLWACRELASRLGSSAWTSSR